eukprot:7319536-Prymnesium_polylepis.1
MWATVWQLLAQTGMPPLPRAHERLQAARWRARGLMQVCADQDALPTVSPYVQRRLRVCGLHGRALRRVWRRFTATRRPLAVPAHRRLPQLLAAS